MSISIPKPPDSCNSIAIKLLSISFTLYFFIALLCFTLQLNYEFQQEKKILLSELNQFQQILSPAIQMAHANNNIQQLEDMIKAALGNKNLIGLMIYTPNKILFSFGEIDPKSITYQTYALKSLNIQQLFYKDYRIESLDIHLKLFSSGKVIFSRIKNHLLLTFMNMLILAIILFVILYLVINQILSQPLSLLEKAANTLDIKHLQNLHFKENTFHSLEIQRMSSNLNEMIQKLSKQVNINQKVATTFEKFVPKQFLQRIARNGIENIQLGNQANTEKMSVLFSDIHYFTELTEQMTPQEVLNFINAYLARVSIPIQEHSGFIDKFLGDGIMALFDRKHQSATDSVKSAIAMIEMLLVYNQDRHKAKYEPISIGIGIHTGQVVIGTIGSHHRMESTVLGDVVNLSSRIQHLTKYYDTQIIISSDTFERLHDNSILCRELDFIHVKGKKTPTTIFEVFNADNDDRKAKKMQLLSPYYQGLSSYYAQNWDRALSFFEACLEILADDSISKMYIKRCYQYQKIPPPDNWNGALRFNSKH